MAAVGICQNGHEKAEKGPCAECGRDRWRRYYARNREAVLAAKRVREKEQRIGW